MPRSHPIASSSTIPYLRPVEPEHVLRAPVSASLPTAPNSEERQAAIRAKARERMARNRELLKHKSLEEQERARALANEAQARYRSRNRQRLSANQSRRRTEAYIRRFGELAYDDYLDKKYEKRVIKADRDRRARRRACGLSKRAAQAREKVVKRLRGTVA
ncbi:hypothetical protein B0H11DRAFT_2214108 [Mycena galericulata]|nr:hypothetical protein B0H11DRAFT_2214108 [Mycena galericulata]